MSYEQDCKDYAVNGDPQRDAMEYEENARFDFQNELREEFFDEEPEAPLTDEEKRAFKLVCEQLQAEYDAVQYAGWQDAPF